MDMKSRRNYLIFAIVALFITPVVLWVNHSNRYPRKIIKPFPDMTIVLEKEDGRWHVISHEYPNFMDRRAKKYVEAFPVNDQVPSSYIWRTNEYANNFLFDEAIASQTKMISLMENASNKDQFKSYLPVAKKHLVELKFLKKSSVKTIQH